MRQSHDVVLFLWRKDLDDDGAALLEGIPLPLLPGDLEPKSDDDATVGRHSLVQNVPEDLSIFLPLIFLAFFVEFLFFFQKRNLMVSELFQVITRGFKVLVVW